MGVIGASSRVGDGDMRPSGETAKLDPSKKNPFKTDPVRTDPTKTEQIPPEARQILRQYVESREAPGRISADEFTPNTDIGRQLQDLGVTPGKAMQYARSYAQQAGEGGPRGDPHSGPRTDNGGKWEGRGEQRIDPNATYFTPRELQVRYNLPQTIQGSNLIGLYTALSLGSNGILSPAAQARLQVELGALGIEVGANLQAGNLGTGNNVTAGGLFRDLTAWVAGPGGGSTAAGPVGFDGSGRPIYTDSLGRLVDGSGRLVPVNAQGQPITADGRPIPLTSASAPSAATGGNPTSASVPTVETAASATTTTAGASAAGSTAAPAGAGASGTASPSALAAATTTAAAAAATAGGPSTVVGPSGSSTGGPPSWAPAYGYRGEHGQGHGKGHGYDHDLGRAVFDTVQGLLSSLLGGQISRGQTQQVVSQLSPADLSAFLANPSEVPASVIAALMNVVSHGHHGRDRSEALLALFDALIAKGPTPGDVRQFFESLTTMQVQHLITHRAEVIGNLPGVPPAVRYAANLFRIGAELNNLDGRTQAEVRRAETLETFLADRGQFLHFDNAPNGSLSRGVVSQVFGDLTQAQHVALLAFGRGNSMDTFSGLAQRAQLLHEVAQPLVREGTAVISWLESLSPALGRQYLAMLAGWQAKGQARNESQFLHLMQQAAAKQMTQQTLPGLMLRGDARMTLIGHSFGSAIVKESLLQGAKPDACVFLGIPEQRLQKVAKQAGCGETDLYALLNHGDVVDELAVEDEEPERAATVSELDDDVDWLAPGDLGPPIEAVLEPHQDYLLEGSASLAQVVNVVVGRDVKLLPPKPQVITLYRSADGTFGDLREPVERMTRGD